MRGGGAEAHPQVWIQLGMGEPGEGARKEGREEEFTSSLVKGPDTRHDRTETTGDRTTANAHLHARHKYLPCRTMYVRGGDPGRTVGQVLVPPSASLWAFVGPTTPASSGYGTAEAVLSRLVLRSVCIRR